MQRTTKYLAQQKNQNKALTKLRSLCLGLATRASFPDSGYYYAQKEMAADRLYRKLKKQIKPNKFKRWEMFLDLDIAQAEYNYYVKPRVIIRGQSYTAADMDRAMACN